MNVSQRLMCLAVVIVFFTGCSTTAGLTRQQVLNEYGDIAALEGQLLTSKQAGVDYLAPTAYIAASEELEAAIGAAADGNDLEVEQFVNSGSKQLQTAEANADKSRTILREVLEVRERAIQANATSLQKAQFMELEDELQKATRAVEEGEVEDAKEMRPELMAGYSHLELSALKVDATQSAKEDIAGAKEQQAGKYAPKTLKLAEDELGLAISVLEANRTHTDKAKIHALRASCVFRRR